MSQKLPADGFKWVKDLSKFHESFIKHYDVKSAKRHIIEADVEYPKKIINLHIDLPFLSESKKIGRCNKLVCTIKDKENFVIHIRALKQALNHILILKKVHRVIQFNEEAWLKPCIDMNTKLRKEAKSEFEKYFLELMNNSVFGKTMENVRNHRSIEIVTSNENRRKLVSESNYHTTKHISENLFIIEMEKTEVKINKPISLGMRILDISKTLMYENCVKLLLHMLYLLHMLHIMLHMFTIMLHWYWQLFYSYQNWRFF